MFRYPKILIAVASLVTLPALGGCYATLQGDPAYVEVSSVPANIEIYPHTFYEGRTVYYVNDNWYYQDGPRWVYYRQEPAPLYQHRTYYQQRNYIQPAPPANRRYAAAPAVRTSREAMAPPGRSRESVAPPARRIQRERPHNEHQDQNHDRRSER